MRSTRAQQPRARSTRAVRRLAPLVVAMSQAFSALGLAGAAFAQDNTEPPMPATRAKAPVTLNFVNADIEAVSRAIGAMLDRQILVDARVRGQITVTSEKPQPPLEAWRSYLAALRGLGFTVVENAGLLKVVPEAEAKLQAGTVSVGAPTVRGDQILTQIFRLNHENPNNLVAVLRPLISANNTINANPGNGSLIITDYADNLQRLAKIIAALDQPAASEIEVIPVKYALAADLAPLVQKLSETATAGVPGAAAVSGSATSVMVEPRSNSLIVRAANPTRMNNARSLIEKLDRPIPGGGPAGNIWVVYLKNADAVKLAEVLRAAMASGAASASSSGSTSSSGLTGLSGASRPTPAQNQPTGIQTSGASSGQSSVATTPVSASAGPSTGGQIQADPSTNSLIISAPEAVYRQMRQVIDQLDTRRAQIYVETMIVKVDANKAAEFGIQWQGIIGSTKNNTIGYAGTNYGSGNNNIANLTLSQFAGTSTSTDASSASIGQGLNIGILNRINGAFTLGALARFLETNTGANVLSTPNLVALDNEEAKIVIGSNVPFTTGSFTNTGTGNGAVNPFQTIERKDVGITLKIKSQIGENGTVRMTIYQESSSLRQDNSQITDKSSIESTVVVDDGQTMVLGGLLKDEYGDSEGRVPGLASLPIVGNLFRNETRNRTKSNLMLFLRPVVLRTPGAADAVTVDRYDAIRALQQNSQPSPDFIAPITDSPIIPQRMPGSGAPASPITTPPNPPEGPNAPAAPAPSSN
ncbi:MAG TPA: type II secretion system secretin GspD [Ideonella sp.]|uniref:type II secretion system secretin GspD n=1 Tax=Ideonella sp. TaxID=1929293 RepID=UPI002B925F34|nr:type II secretion system secretin GspD [Ideonella sp.]HSI49755.1 type II secretion system secretin GspD [Ideonella sp.]